MAQILGDDQVRSKLFEEIGVNGVKAFTAGNVLTNLGVDFGGRGVVGNAGADDNSFGAGARRKIAFMADADDLVVELQGEENLGGGGKEGGNAHAADCTTK